MGERVYDVYDIDNLQESMVKILNPENGEVIGSGFIIRHDGYLVTCHHVIYELDRLEVEYRGKPYNEVQWCQELSAPGQDVAVLKIDVESARAVPIVNPADLPMPVVLCGFPLSEVEQFSSGFDYHAREIHRSFPVDILSTYYSTQKPGLANPWNVLPGEDSRFSAYRVSVKVDRGTSGGPAFSEELSGAVGIVQSSGGGVSYVIRWDNISVALVKLSVDPTHNAVCQFLEDMEEELSKVRLFHCRQQEVILRDYYIPIQVTLERRYMHEVETSWGYAESEAEASRAYALKGIDDEHRPSQVPWEEARGEKRIIVLADPGMGKTTLLKMEAVSIAQRERQKLSGNGKSLDDIVFPIPLKLSELDAQEGDIVEDISDLIGRRYPGISQEIVPLLRRKLEDGKCVLLLDALDEVPREDRFALSEKLNRFVRSYEGQIICTSRIVGYGGAFLHDAREAEIVPFSRKQTEQYVRTWFANAADSIQDDSVSAQGLLHELRSKPQIQGLAQNPLLLSLLCSLYQEKEITLPARRCQVYEKAADCMLSKWPREQGRRPISEWDVVARVRLLEELAYHFSCQGREIFSVNELYDSMERYIRSEEAQSSLRALTTADLLEELSEDYGILQKLERNGDRYIFLHRTFQEYFTASYLSRMENRIDLAREHFWDFDWHETLTLLAGLMDDPLPLLQDIMDEKDDIFSSMLLLAGRCMTECESHSVPLMEDITDRIYRFWREHIDEDFIFPTVVDVGQAVPRMLEHLVEDLEDTDCDFRRHAVEALGEIGSEEAVDALTMALDDQDSDIRGRITSMLGNIGSERALEVLTVALDDQDSKVRDRAALSLGKIGSDKAVDALIAALEDQDGFVRISAAEALGKIGSEQVVDALIVALGHRASKVRAGAASALEEIRSEKAVDALIAALEDQDSDVGRSAAQALGNIGSEKAVDALIAVLEDQDSDVGSRAAQALGDIGSEKAVDALIAALDDQVGGVRGTVASELGYIGNEKAVDALIVVLDDESWYVRSSAAQALGDIGSEKAVDALIAALEDQDRGVRTHAVEALGKIGGEKAADALILALEHQYSDVRMDAVEALGKIGSEKAVDALIVALEHQDRLIRLKAARAFAKIDSEKAVGALILALEHQDRLTRSNAAYVLGEICSEKAVDALIMALGDQVGFVRSSAAEALGKIGSGKAVDALVVALEHLNSDVIRRAAGTLSNLDILEKLISSPGIDIYESDIFSLARRLAVRFSKEKSDFIPVYPEKIR